MENEYIWYKHTAKWMLETIINNKEEYYINLFIKGKIMANFYNVKILNYGTEDFDFVAVKEKENESGDKVLYFNMEEVALIDRNIKEIRIEIE